MAPGSTDAFGRPLREAGGDAGAAEPPAGAPASGAAAALPSGAAAAVPAGAAAALPSGVALDDPLTRSSLERYRRRGRWITVAGGALLIAFFVVVSIQAHHAKWLLQHGARAQGRITSVAQNARGGGSFAVEYPVGGRLRHGTIALTESSPFYAAGEAVTVIYDTGHPGDIRTPVEKNEPGSTVLPLMLALIAGLILLVGGVGTLVRARSWRRLLSASPWRAYRARYLARVTRGRLRSLGRGLEVVSVDAPSAAPAVLRLSSTWRWRSERMARHDGETIWLAGDPGGKVVLCVPAGRELLAAGAPRANVAGSYRRAGAVARAPQRSALQLAKARRRFLGMLVAQWSLFAAVWIWRTQASVFGIAVVTLYGVALIPVAVVVVGAIRNAGERSTGA